jgi:hypothetical protein
MAMEDLRKWKAWHLTERIVALYGRPGFDVPIIKRAILRFALSCPEGNEKAKEFIEKRKKEDPQYVEEVAELLRLEAPRPDPAPATKK